MSSEFTVPGAAGGHEVDASMLEALFSQSREGMLFMLLDQPVRWDDSTDKEVEIEYVMAHLRFTRVNDAFLAQRSLSREDVLGMTPNRMWADALEERRSGLRNLYDQGRLSMITSGRRRDGTPIWVEGEYVCLYDEDGRIRGHFGIQRDITERVRLEQELRARETQMALVFNTASDRQVLLRVEPGDRLIGEAANRAYLEAVASSFGRSHAASILGRERRDYMREWGIPPEHLEVEMPMYREAIASGEIVRYEQCFPTPTGEMALEISISPVVGSDGICTHLLWNAHDIGAHKQAMARIQASLKEKEILLSEVHHRVKNNLQIVSGLLYLQSRSTTDNQTKEMLLECRARVLSMAMVHEQLYQTSDFSHVDFAAYLQRLGETLFSTYGVSQNRIALQIEAADIALDVSTAIPCGLMANELISNALKHAFPSEAGGCITIRMRQEGGQYHLHFSDNGIGIALGETPRPNSLGLRLLQQLCDQLGARLERGGPPGTAYDIHFALESGAESGDTP